MPAKAAPKQSKPKPVAVEVVKDHRGMDLATIRKALETERDTIIKHEDAFEAAVLPRYLRMGLQCHKAHHLFANSDPAKRGQGRKGKQITSTADVISADAPPESFEAWLATAEMDWLKKATAYRYMRGVTGLGLDHTATEPQLIKALKAAQKEASKQGKKLSLNQLANNAPLIGAGEEEQEDPNTPADKAGEARVAMKSFIRLWDNSVKAGNIEDLDAEGLHELEEFFRNQLDHIKRRLKSAK